jgi:hypothetical protein
MHFLHSQGHSMDGSSGLSLWVSTLERLECNAKCLYPKKLTCKTKGTWRQVFYLSEAPSHPITPYSPLHTVYAYTVYICTQERGEGGRLY